MATQFPRVPTSNNQQYTLDAQAAAGASTVTLNQSVAGIVQAPGYFVVDRIDTSGNKTATKREYKKFTGVSGANLTGVTNVDGTDQVHAVGAIVEFVPDVKYEADWYDAITTEHTILGQHASLPSLTLVKTLSMMASIASISAINTNNIVGFSQASLSFLQIGNHLGASGASLTGIFPSGASGYVLTSQGQNLPPVYAPGSGTGGFNAVFQVPGGLASLANTMGRVTVPTAFTGQFMTGYLNTPASLASVWVQVNKNGSIYGVIGWLAGATFASSASIASAALSAGDFLEGDIRSTASLAADLSITLRAT